jgi:hypothetical protein
LDFYKGGPMRFLSRVWTRLSLIGLGLVVLAGQSGAAATPKLAQFEAIASGTLSFVATYSACSELSCPANDECFCFQFAGPISGSVIGNSTLAMETSQDSSIETASGTTGVNCNPGSGAGAITAKGGSLSFDFFGQFCTDTNDARLFNGVYRVQSGTGKFAGAFGGGNLDYGEISPGGNNTPVTFTGALAK